MVAKKQKKRTSHTPIPGVVQAHAAFLQMQATPDMSPDVLYSTEDGGSCGCAQHAELPATGRKCTSNRDAMLQQKSQKTCTILQQAFRAGTCEHSADIGSQKPTLPSELH